MGSKICVTIDGVQKEYEEGTTYQTLAREVQEQYEDEIVLAKNGNTLQELISRIKPGKISFLIRIAPFLPL